MSHKVIFYPVGNGDTSQIVLENGKRILFDFRHLKKTEAGDGPEINLSKRLKQELKDSDKTEFDVVAFTHGDKDHIANSTEFFELLHAQKYQGDGRIKIKTLWVPAAMILETASTDEQSEEYVLWRQEARYRLKEGKGIRVFSKPDRLKEWLEENGLKVSDRKSLITDAGEIVADFSLEKDGVEFFCHSPFVKHIDENEEFRNEAALIFNVRFKIENQIFDYLAIGDSEFNVLEDIVDKSKKYKRKDRLSWDILNIPHHCSYKALSDEKGEEETTPKEKVKELLLSGKEGSLMISSSDPIPDSAKAYLEKQPPHIQARKCYERYLKKVGGSKLLVTMEESNASNPNPIEIKVEKQGISIEKLLSKAQSIAISKPAKAG
ncbi:hypothetical protein QMN07_14800 [Leptospira santarosai]|uniref:hypothetical protein n=1 Tax=Leptospira santarosai TaxID=28183 RepID=UPI0024AF9654|nr:hypothetical protein [Leptospira santarosai]MDI7218768.1 hypothetical protein [Leptospira santarosai]